MQNFGDGVISHIYAINEIFKTDFFSRTYADDLNFYIFGIPKSQAFTGISRFSRKLT